MTKKILSILIFILIVFAGCSINNQGQTTPSEADVDAQLNKNVATMMDYYAKALTSKDPSVVSDFKSFLSAFDAKYGSDCAGDFEKSSTPVSRISTSSDYPPLADLPIAHDGDVYLSGGVSDAVSAVITWVAPNVTRGNYVHGAVIDTNKFDPTNLDCACFQTAVASGAAYETPNEWMRKPNVAVMTPAFSVNNSSLQSSQAAVDAYCSGSIPTSYGFFKNMVDITSQVTKSDNSYWYCTKTVWRVYNGMGVDIDSNSPLIDWTTSGLYSVVKAYYKTIYFWSPSLANKKLNEYIANTRSNLVLAEEIYYSPLLNKIYETIRY
jgi:hypothetical protein